MTVVVESGAARRTRTPPPCPAARRARHRAAVAEGLDRRFGGLVAGYGNPLELGAVTLARFAKALAVDPRVIGLYLGRGR